MQAHSVCSLLKVPFFVQGEDFLMSPENSGLGKTSGFVGVGKNGKLAAKPPGSHCKTGIVAVIIKNQMKTVSFSFSRITLVSPMFSSSSFKISERSFDLEL